MVARQLKIVSQVDAFTFSATRNIQYVFKKLVCLIVFVKDIFDTVACKNEEDPFKNEGASVVTKDLPL